MECDKGKYKDAAGGAPCVSCPPNSITLSTGSTSALNCSCRQGFAGPNSTACIACEPGLFARAVGSLACTACPNNSKSEDNYALSLPGISSVYGSVSDLMLRDTDFSFAFWAKQSESGTILTQRNGSGTEFLHVGFDSSSTFTFRFGKYGTDIDGGDGLDQYLSSGNLWSDERYRCDFFRNALFC